MNGCSFHWSFLTREGLKPSIVLMDGRTAQPMTGRPTPGCTRRAWVCGVCAMGAAIVAPPLAREARADDHTTERRIDRQVYDSLRKQGAILDESPYYPALREIGARISQAAEPHWWTPNYIIVKTAGIHAFTTPGGNVYVFEDLLKATGNRDELANVLGHETAHNTLGHIMTRIHQALTFDILMTIGACSRTRPERSAPIRSGR